VFSTGSALPVLPLSTVETGGWVLSPLFDASPPGIGAEEGVSSR
jgi:hypothetical protein